MTLFYIVLARERSINRNVSVKFGFTHYFFELSLAFRKVEASPKRLKKLIFSFRYTFSYVVDLQLSLIWLKTRLDFSRSTFVFLFTFQQHRDIAKEQLQILWVALEIELIFWNQQIILKNNLPRQPWMAALRFTYLPIAKIRQNNVLFIAFRSNEYHLTN